MTIVTSLSSRDLLPMPSLHETHVVDRARGGAPFFASITMTDDGLVCGAGSILARMRTGVQGKPRLAINEDQGRLCAMLSAAFDRKVVASDVVPHVEAAAAHWQRGDKALANIRLIVARFPRLRDPVAAERLRLAEYVLDRGLSPDALMKELGFAPQPSGFQKYWEDQPRVPAGHGSESGRWVDGGPNASSLDRPEKPIVLAADEGREEDEKTFHERELTGQTSVGEDVAHGRGIRPLRILPVEIGPGPFAGRSIPAGPSARPSPNQQLQIDAIGKKTGCHTCGTIEPDTPQGKFIGDHQPSTALIPLRRADISNQVPSSISFRTVLVVAARKAVGFRASNEGNVNNGSFRLDHV